MSKSRDAFRTISEVSDVLDTPAHVLRFWESKFTQVKPIKRAGGRRYYRPADVDLLAGIKQVLHDDGMTIKGAQKMLREQGIKHVSALGSDALDLTSAAKTAITEDPVVNATPVPARSVPDPAIPEPAIDVEITNVTPLPTSPTPGSTVSLDLKPTEPPEPDVVQQIAKPALNIPDDPSDGDSKAPARLFHLLHKASHDKLAARAQDIAPLLDRMQVLRDRIATR